MMAAIPNFSLAAKEKAYPSLSLILRASESLSNFLLQTLGVILFCALLLQPLVIWLSRPSSLNGKATTQNLTWDSFGRLVKVADNKNTWTAIYDGLGRRIQTSVGSNAINHYYDPEVEFLELGHSINGSKSWNLYGPDRSGFYGGAQGIGGLEVEGGSATLQNYFGDVIGLGNAGVIANYGATFTSYGLAPGSAPDAASQSLTPQWRGRYLDETGFVSMGARYYEPHGGRFLSADPLGHDASLSLYDYCNGDPLNGLDPDGRCGKGMGTAAYDIGTGTVKLGSNILGSTAYAITSGFGMFQNGYSDNFTGSWEGLQNTWGGLKYLGSQALNGNFTTVGVALTGGEGRSVGFITGYAATSILAMALQEK